MLLSKNIGLWDVLKSANRKGSTDQKIDLTKQHEFNDIKKFITDNKLHINTIIFNGNKPNKYFNRRDNPYKFIDKKIKFIVLPSTSLANPSITEKDLISIWKNTINKCNP